MAISPTRLLNWKVPDRTHVLSRKEVAFYALSVGCSQDQEESRDLRYVDPGQPDFVALPSMALVMAYPGFWLGEPDVGIDSLRVVHAEQSIEILTDLPAEGTIRGRTRITHLADGGVGKSAFLYSERDLFDETDCNFARVYQTHILRGAGGFGGKSARPPMLRSAVEGSPHYIVEYKTRHDQALLYRLNGDLNPIHSDPVVARRAGFPRPILHGMCTFGFVARALIQSLCDNDPSRMRSMSLRFTGLVYPGETIRVEILSNGSFRARAVERDTIVVDHGSVHCTASGKKLKVEKHAV